jgi:hypothetical protein
MLNAMIRSRTAYFLPLLAGALLGFGSARALEITTKDGKTYTGVSIVGNDESHLSILHDQGGAKIHFEYLNEELQKKYNYDRFKVWFTEYELAKEISKESGRPLLAFFWVSDQAVSQKPGVKPDPKASDGGAAIRKKVFNRNDFKRLAYQKLVLFEADYPTTRPQPKEIRERNAKLKQELEITEMPALVLLSANGESVGQVPLTASHGKDGSTDVLTSLQNMVVSATFVPPSEASPAPAPKAEPNSSSISPSAAPAPAAAPPPVEPSPPPASSPIASPSSD